MQSRFFGHSTLGDIDQYTLENRHGLRVGVLNLGGIVQEISLLQHDNTRRNLVIHFDDAEHYIQNPFQINKQIGRVAGRIQNAEFELKGQTWQVEANEGKHALHGGSHGLGSQILTLTHCSAQELTLHTTLRQEVDSYPNQLNLWIDYILDDDNRLTIRYRATAIGDTVFDPTLHIYWRLPESLDDAILTLPNSQYIQVDSDKMPTAPHHPPPLAYDFRQPKSLALALQQLREGGGKIGFDDVYQVPNDFRQPAAILALGKDVGVKLFSDRNGLVIFTAAPTAGHQHDAGQFNALATELQTLPNSLHHPEFGDIRLHDGESRVFTTIYQIESRS